MPRQPPLRVSVEGGARDGQQRRCQPVPQRARPGGVPGHCLHRPAQRGSHAGNGGQVFRSGTVAPLLAAAKQHIGRLNAPPHIERTRSPGAMELVGGQAEQVNVLRLHIQRQMARRLDGVGVKQHLPLAAERAQLRHRLDGPHLIVGGHHAEQAGIRGERGSRVRRVHPAFFVHAQQGNGKALFLQRAEGPQHGVVLDPGGDKMPPSLRRAPPGGGEQRLHVGFGAAGGEENLAGAGVEHPGHRAAGGFQQRFGLPSWAIDGRGIAPAALLRVRHGRQRFGTGPGGGGVIKIDHGMPPFPPILCRKAYKVNGKFAQKLPGQRLDTSAGAG